MRIFIISEHSIKSRPHFLLGDLVGKACHSDQASVQENFGCWWRLFRFEIHNFSLISQPAKQKDHIDVDVLKDDARPAIPIRMSQLLNCQPILVRFPHGKPAVRIDKIGVKFVIICGRTSSKTPIFYRWKSIVSHILWVSWFSWRVFYVRILLDSASGRLRTLRPIQSPVWVLAIWMVRNLGSLRWSLLDKLLEIALDWLEWDVMDLEWMPVGDRIFIMLFQGCVITCSPIQNHRLFRRYVRCFFNLNFVGNLLDLLEKFDSALKRNFGFLRQSCVSNFGNFRSILIILLTLLGNSGNFERLVPLGFYRFRHLRCFILQGFSLALIKFLNFAGIFLRRRHSLLDHSLSIFTFLLNWLLW